MQRAPPSRLFLRDLFPVTAETSEKKEPSCVDTGGKSSRKRVKSAFTASEESKRHVTVTGWCFTFLLLTSGRQLWANRHLCWKLVYEFPVRLLFPACVTVSWIQESCECSRNMFTAPFVAPGCTGPSFAKEHNCMLCTSCFMFQCHKLHIHLEFEKAVKATLNIPLLSYCLLFFTILLALVLQPLAPSGIHWFKLEPVGMWWSEFSFGHRNLKHRGGKHKVADEGANNVVTKQ